MLRDLMLIVASFVAGAGVTVWLIFTGHAPRTRDEKLFDGSVY